MCGTHYAIEKAGVRGDSTRRHTPYCHVSDAIGAGGFPRLETAEGSSHQTGGEYNRGFGIWYRGAETGLHFAFYLCDMFVGLRWVGTKLSL